MNLIAFDYFKRLERVGFTQEQATVLVALATEASNEMVNKQELGTLEKDIKQEIILSESKVENSINQLRIELLREIQAIHIRIEKLEGEVKFIKGLCVFIAGVISTTSLLFGMIKFFLH